MPRSDLETRTTMRVWARIVAAPATAADVARDLDITPNMAWIAFRNLRLGGRIDLDQVVGRHRVYRALLTPKTAAPDLRGVVRQSTGYGAGGKIALEQAWR